MSLKQFGIMCVGLAMGPSCAVDSETVAEVAREKQQASDRMLVQCRRSNVSLELVANRLRLHLDGSPLEDRTFRRTWEPLERGVFRHVFTYTRSVLNNVEPWAPETYRVIDFTLLQTGTRTSLHMKQERVKWLSRNPKHLEHDLSVRPLQEDQPENCDLSLQLLDAIFKDTSIVAQAINRR